MTIPADPLDPGGIRGFGRRMRAGETTAVAATEAYLARIAAYDRQLQTYEHVAASAALRAAKLVDEALAGGVDFGPLMGVPIAIKDIIAVEGMPTTAGSDVDVSDLIGGPGGFMRSLAAAGCVIIGKTKAVEFAMSGTGTNYRRGTPRNPWDAAVFRLTAGSSSGSAAAVAAGLCGFAIGTDTGGSIRGPAAFCGVFGLKPTANIWPTDGSFPVSATLDTIGPLTRSAEDAAIVWAALCGTPVPPAATIRGVKLGRPRALFGDLLDRHVAARLEGALSTLAAAGVTIVEMDIPELAEIDPLFRTISLAEMVTSFGRERFHRTSALMNPDIAASIAAGFDITQTSYASARRRQQELVQLNTAWFNGIDAWVGPVKWKLPPAFPGDFTSLSASAALLDACAGPTRSANVLGLCAASLPLPHAPSTLPTGLQLICPGRADELLLSLACTFESVLGRSPSPDLSGFARS
ncbi:MULTISPECIES: amidase [unclassified Mesorhizobium]|uniref:amidase n=1 Tax=unclassified Mesorhizobium TaxID=325217 RepID=UPI001128E29D|nr:MULTISPECIES: amidase [unclassified Mesorhizobium]TPM95428.1 amidase [Mesorhizobium sp. B2-1-5]TPJ48346.1 amidase [Mesorhizobium sp. B2-6-4]TPK49032.1 amidase [Mesorhizobium sp. B2-5-2]TPL23621.1 amidase [Mesorhizobium sp. B2-4-7]TPL26166.1 amidase [Mesorhizobium sp. B2-4-9]